MCMRANIHGAVALIGVTDKLVTEAVVQRYYNSDTPALIDS